MRPFRHLLLLPVVALGFTQPESAAAHSDLTLVNFGGNAARAQMTVLLRPWERSTGKYTTMEEYNGGIDEIRRQVNTANVTWDVIDMEYSDLIQACDEGLLEVFDHSILPPASDGTPADSDFRTDALHKCGVGNLVWSTVYAYEGDDFDQAPSTIQDFFDVEAFPGNRGIRRDPRGILEWALMADGIAPADIYTRLDTPEGLDQAFDKLDALSSSIVWWDRGDQPAKLLAEKSVSLTMAWNGRLYRPITEDGRDIQIIWDGQVWDYDLFAIPKGARNADAAKEFISYATSTDKLGEWVSQISYGPARVSAMAKVSPELLPLLPTTDANLTNALRYDSQWWAQNIDRIRPRFEAFASPNFGAEGALEGRF